MRAEWHEKSLGDVIDIKHGFAFSGENIHDEPHGDILLTPGNFAIGGTPSGGAAPSPLGVIGAGFLVAGDRTPDKPLAATESKAPPGDRIPEAA